MVLTTAMFCFFTVSFLKWLVPEIKSISLLFFFFLQRFAKLSQFYFIFIFFFVLLCCMKYNIFIITISGNSRSDYQCSSICQCSASAGKSPTYFYINYINCLSIFSSVKKLLVQFEYLASVISHIFVNSSFNLNDLFL